MGFHCTVYWWNVSWVIFCSNTSISRRFLTKWKTFSIGFKSGLRGGIASNLAPTDAIAFRAFALFCLGSPSWINKHECPFLLFRRISGKCSVTKLLKNSPSNRLYSSQHITPCLKEIATKSCKTLPPVPTCAPFAVHPVSRPSLVCRQTRPFGARLWSHGLYLWAKLAPSK